MIETLLLELLRGISFIIYQPLFYWFFLLLIIVSVKRAKQERLDFGSKIYQFGAELRNTWWLSFTSMVILSGAFIVSGSFLPISFIVLLSAWTIVLSITGNLTLLSPAYVFGMTFVTVLLLVQFSIPYIPTGWYADLYELHYPLVLLILSLFLLMEAILVFATREGGFPRLLKGKRGKFIGIQKVNRLTVLPLFVLIPTGDITLPIQWWPVFPVGNGGFHLMLVPFLIGVDQSFQGMYAKAGAKLLGKWILLLALLTGVAAIGSFYVPVVAYIGIGIALIGRFIIFLSVRFVDQEKLALFSPQSDGLPILSVIPHSPAHKMGLEVGEKIEKVNQIPVSNEQEFYEAIQRNRTFCKLEVRNLDGELRFVQRALYEGEHHELGLVFIKEKPRFRLYQDLS
ncbi:PDZ domain-containing protein [Salirhabdus salicampi]|uniref:PDZ domain-containing protein n=1 Tax=Salirhabdus salicampi TaxID=476102 RepID=UPI0020C2413A|nr:PDZ domain-containing protein [Salirhabdus salicampi]MCP8617623.1 PDZ domain-containing protein [Salirhabdus salicampi]